MLTDEPIYIGALPWPANDSTPTSFRFPSTVWTANLRQGYVGCLKNVRFNGISANIASVYEEQKTLVEAGWYFYGFLSERILCIFRGDYLMEN